MRVRLPPLWVAGLLVGCPTEPVVEPDPTPAPPPPLHDPTAPGPYAVGSRTIFVWDAERERGLDAEVWYPAIPGTGSGEAPPFALMDAEVDAAPDLTEAPMPLIAFSHGSRGIRAQSVSHTEWLATHGYVVVAPDHPGNTIFDDGDDVPMWLTAWNRPQDVSAAIDVVLRISGDSRDPLFEAVDPGRIGAVGHSFGSWTSMMLAGQVATQGPFDEVPAEAPPPPWDFRDERVLAAIPMNPGGYESVAEGLAETPIPILYMASAGDEILPIEEEALPLFEGTPGAGLAMLQGAGHFTYSDMCSFLPNYGDGCGEGWLDPELAWPVTNAWAGAFFGLHVKGDERYLQWLQPDREVPEWASIEWKEGALEPRP